MEYFKEDYLTLSYNESLNLVTAVWDMKFVKADLFKKGALAGLELLVQKQSTAYLIDTSQMGVLSLELQRWIQSQIEIYTTKMNLRYVATVVGKDVFNKVAAKNIQNHAEKKQEEAGKTVITEFFQNRTDAIHWISGLNIHKAA
ncbi:hypothetical protein [Xanthocytophaga agilis]|uniref:STAS/SEC14 domain-containing protein n=1 Tax=Xanthocytophaga agilis TaxID=3048010 RepID=A0AAE3QXV1_9BACT|nr:hypothetical protein [Xanthocytophaga agilis]MDJ1500054.1 hypothetical protein [Xanthocytophaga agilis]